MTKDDRIFRESMVPLFPFHKQENLKPGSIDAAAV